MSIAPDISVITPIYDRPDYLLALFETLRAQTFENWELILVDDASPVKIRDAFEKVQSELPGGPDPRFHLIERETNGGPGAARNTGIAHAKGRFIAFLDSDDSWQPQKLNAQYDAILAQPEPDLSACFCCTTVRYPNGQDLDRPSRGLSTGESGAGFLYVENEFAQCSAIFCGAQLLRSQSIQFEDMLKQYEDHLFFMTLVAKAHRTIMIPQTLSNWQHDSRPDRMGARDDLDRGARFMKLAGAQSLMNATEALAFQLRCLGPVIAERNRPAAIRLAIRGAREPGMPRDAWLKLFLVVVLGPRLFGWLREKRR